MKKKNLKMEKYYYQMKLYSIWKEFLNQEYFNYNTYSKQFQNFNFS